MQTAADLSNIPSTVPNADTSASTLPEGVDPQQQPQPEPEPELSAAELKAQLAEEKRRVRKLEGRIDRRTKAIGELSGKLAQYEAGAGRKPVGVTTPDPDDNDDDDAPAVDVETRAEQLAEAKLAAKRISDGAKAMLAAGTKLEPKFRDLVNDLAQDLPLVDRTGRATEFTEQVLDCQDPAALLLHIARNPDVAESLHGLTGRALTRKLVALESEAAKAAPEPSKAAKVLDPLRPNAGAANEPRDSDTPEEWRRKEAARINAKRGVPSGHAAASR